MEMYITPTYLTHDAEIPDVAPPELLLKAEACRSTALSQLALCYSAEVAVMPYCTTHNIVTIKEQNALFPFCLKKSLIEGDEKTFKNNYHVNHISIPPLSTA